MLKYFSTIVVFSSVCTCFAAQDVEVQNPPNAVHNNKLLKSDHPSNLDRKTLSTPQINDDKRPATIVDVKNKAIEAARAEKIEETSIEKALKERDVLLKASPELKDKEFYITKKGFLVFHNYL